MTTPPAHLHRQAMAAWEDGRRTRRSGLLRDAVRAVGRPRAAQRPRGGDGGGRRRADAAAAVLRPCSPSTRATQTRATTSPRSRRPGRRRPPPTASASRRCWPARSARPLAAGCSATCSRRRRPGQEALHARLDELPSATTVGERWFFHNLRRAPLERRRDIFENGPLMGGTTRAPRLGMLANPRRRPEALLHTHDWFNSAIGLDVDDAIASSASSRAGRCAARRARAVRDRRLPARLRGAARRTRLPPAAGHAHAGAAGLPAPRRTRWPTSSRTRRRALRGRLRGRLQELVRHALLPGAHPPRPRARRVRRDAGLRLVHLLLAARRWSACCPEHFRLVALRRPHVRVRAAAPDQRGRRGAVPRPAARSRRVGPSTTSTQACAPPRWSATTAGRCSR